MQSYDFSETLFHFLTTSSREIDMGPVVRQYILGQNQPEFYFFTKMPETTLNIAVYECFGGEIHQVDSDAFRVRRFLYTPTKLVDAELDDLMQKKGFVKMKDKYESLYLIAIPFKDGLVYATRSCRWNFGEGPKSLNNKSI
jgi:hypothetical protein